MNYIDTRSRIGVGKKYHPSTKRITIRALDKWLTVNEKKEWKKEMIPYSNFHGVRFFPLSRQRSVLFPFVICRFALYSTLDSDQAWMSSSKFFVRLFIWNINKLFENVKLWVNKSIKINTSLYLIAHFK